MATPAEQDIYLRFKTVVPELAGAVDDLEHERPDVVTSTVDGRTIGIELTGFFHGTAPKGDISQAQREEFQRRVVRDAQRIFEANGGPPLHVRVIWYGHTVTDSAERLAEALADLITVHLPTVPPTANHAVVAIEKGELPDLLALWVNVVSIIRTARDTAHYWTVPQAGMLDVTSDGVRERIEDKEQKLASYRQCDENWLLIHSGDQTMAAAMTLHDSAAEDLYTTSFDRVYVLDILGDVHQLRTC